MFEYINVTLLQKNPVVVRSNINHKEYVLLSTHINTKNENGREQREKIYFFGNPEFDTNHYHKEKDFPKGYKLWLNYNGVPHIFRDDK